MATNAGSKTIAPYGAWSSPITSDLLVQKNISIASIHPLVSPNGSRIVYSEARPSENGRTALILRDVDSNEQDGRDLTGGKYNARCGVHEYGGGAAVELPDSGLLFTDFGSRRVYRVGQAEGQEPVPVTPGEWAARV